MPSNNPGPPPVRRTQPETEGNLPVATRNYLTVVDTLKANGGAEARAIRAMFGGDKKLMDRFLAVAFSALASDSNILRQATPMSLVQAIKDSASLGLEPMSQDAAIVVYGDQAKLMIQWRGYVKRIRNSRQVVDLDCQLVYANDVFELSLGTSPELRHVPALPEKDDEGKLLNERGDYRGCYAWALMPSGKYIIEWMTTDDIEYVRQTWGNNTSRNGKPLPWATSWGEMARKTVIRRLAKRLPAAAVDQLLAVEQAHDAAQDELRDLSKQVSDGLSEVRNLALRAVGTEPQLGAGNEQKDPQGGPTEPEADAGPDDADSPGGAAVPAEPKEPDSSPGAEAPPGKKAGPDPGSDPNVQAALAQADEDERLRRYREATSRR